MTTILSNRTLRDGAGVPLVLLHGFPLDHRMWSAVAEELPPGIQTIAIDLPGHGHSDLGSMPPRLELAADAVHDTLRELGEVHAVVVGLSMGGYVALAMAERHPDMVRGLGLVDTKSTADGADARANRQRVIDAVVASQTLDAVLGMPAKLLGPTTSLERRHLFPLVDSWVRSQSPASVIWAQRAMLARPDRTHVLEGFTGPVAVVVGAEDEITPQSDAKHMAAAAPGATLTLVRDAGHLSPVENPGPVAAALATMHRRVTRP